MQGRYEVEVCDECGREVSDSEHATSRHQNGPTHWVQTVPCDDAAITRVADMLAYNDACGPGPVSRSEYLADAEAVLRAAAGETP